jgi:glucosamine-6-phosphate deaminase
MTRIQTVRELTAEKLKVNIYNTREEMGAQAARDAAEKIAELLLQKDRFVNIIFAAAPSQSEFLNHLSQQNGIDWSRVNAFHMDEYVGISKTAMQSFGWFLKESFFGKVPLKKVYYINGDAEDSHAECSRYATLLNEFPADIVCMGIGENTHIAFNDPHTANFNDPELVKVVTLDEVSRQQQVHDGCFPAIDAVPTSAITLTVPALLSANTIFCMVPGKNKAAAVYHTIHNVEDEKFPSTSLKKHPGVTLYLDTDSAAKL